MNEKDTDLEFQYGDCDTFETEIAELYSYSEIPEFEENKKKFREFLLVEDKDTWIALNEEEKQNVVLSILRFCQLEEDENDVERNKSISALLYLAQGVFGEVKDNEEQVLLTKENCFLLYKLGAFDVLMEILKTELNKQVLKPRDSSDNASLEDSKILRQILSIVYTMIESIRTSDCDNCEETAKLREKFINELQSNLEDGENSLISILFTMVSKFCLLNCPSYPMKKVLLLIWKVILTSLGNFQHLQDEKKRLRLSKQLKLLGNNGSEDPISIVTNMRASQPPNAAHDILMLNNSVARQRRKRMVNMEPEAQKTTEENKANVFEEYKVTSIDAAINQPEQSIDKLNQSDSSVDEKPSVEAVPPGVMTPAIFSKPKQTSPDETTDVGKVAKKLVAMQLKQKQEVGKEFQVEVPTGLPWEPKVSDKDLNNFLSTVRNKFIGYTYNGDTETVSGLPKPTQESVEILKSHLYTSLTSLQLKFEQKVQKYPFTAGKTEVINDTPAEKMYQVLLVNLPKYIIALLQILLASTKNKTEPNSVNVLSDLLPKHDLLTHSEKMKLTIDASRHREIIIKSISATLLLLLKHFKLNHVYQFEYTGQHLVFANCIPLILKFLNQGILQFVTLNNTVDCLEFPTCVIGEASTELSAESLQNLDNAKPNWKNMFSSINLLRILNKLVKWKHSRTMMLVMFKSAPILKSALKVRQGMFQYYVLKLIKTQTKFLGRQWRKSNMKILSDIYQKVRHHLNDDWAFGNDVDTEPWAFQQEEYVLRSEVEGYNYRRYNTTTTNQHFSDVNNPHKSVNSDLEETLKLDVELPYDFEQTYTNWLDREVYMSETNWDELLNLTALM